MYRTPQLETTLIQSSTCWSQTSRTESLNLEMPFSLIEDPDLQMVPMYITSCCTSRWIQQNSRSISQIFELNTFYPQLVTGRYHYHFKDFCDNILKGLNTKEFIFHNTVNEHKVITAAYFFRYKLSHLISFSTLQLQMPF